QNSVQTGIKYAINNIIQFGNPGNVDKGDHDAIVFFIFSDVGHDSHQAAIAISQQYLLFDNSSANQNRTYVGDEVFRKDVVRNLLDRTANIGLNEIDQVDGCRIELPDEKLRVEKDLADIGTPEVIVEIII